MKTISFHYYKQEIQHIGRILTDRFDGLGADKDYFKLESQRQYFLQEVMVCALNYFNALALFLAICIEVYWRQLTCGTRPNFISIQPIFVPSKSLPFRAIFPFDASEGWAFLLVYGFQIASTFYLLQHILYMDLYGYFCMHECSLHLSILSNEFKILENIPEAIKTKLESKNRLRYFIKNHQQIIK